MDPLVSIVVTTYNQAQYIEETIASALGQTYQNREVIVVDDGSTDDTAARLARFRDRIVYIHQSNRGVAGSRNSGVRSAKGELLAFLDGDDLWEPDKLAVQVAAYQAYPHAGLIAVDACIFSAIEVLRESTLPWSTGVLRAGDGGLATVRCYRELIQGNFIATTSQVMIPALVLQSVGLSDERLKIASDYDLYLRIASAYEMTFVKAVLTRWRYVSTSASGPLALRGMHWFHDVAAVLEKHLGMATAEWRPLIRVTLRRHAFVAARAAYYYGCDHDSAWARGYLARLWARKPSNLWPLVFCVGLSSPSAFRKVAAVVFRRLLTHDPS